MLSSISDNHINDTEKKQRVLLIGDANGYFRVDYARNLNNDKYDMDILSFRKCNPENAVYYNKVIECTRKPGNILNTLRFFLDYYKCLKSLDSYDAIHIHSVKLYHSLFAGVLKKKCRVLATTIYGSDIYRVGKITRFLLRRLFNKSNHISVATEEVKSDFVRFFGKKNMDKIKVAPFGLTQLAHIDRIRNNRTALMKELNIPEGKKIVTIGYNATPQQHQMEIIDLVSKDPVCKELFYVIPLSYGNDELKKKVKKHFEESGLPGVCFCDFWPGEEISKLRVISDIMIQVQDTDAFSASMAEYLYAGNIIITGSWLPYDSISKYINTVSALNEIPELVHKILDSFEEYKQKSTDSVQYLYDNYSWEQLKRRWFALYE